MGKSEHTYLFKQGVWSADGMYHDGEGREFPVRGETMIRHSAGKWLLEGRMCLFGDESTAFSNSCEIVPFDAGSGCTSWFSSNPATGNMTGRFAVVGDTILSEFRSDDGRFGGAESLRQISKYKYTSRGAMFDSGQLISSWALTLEMVRAAGD